MAETTSILERLPTSPEESAQLDHDDMWKQIKYVLSEEKRIVSEISFVIFFVFVVFVVVFCVKTLP